MPCTKTEECALIQLLQQELQQEKEQRVETNRRLDRTDERFDAFQRWLIGILATSLVGAIMAMLTFLLKK